MMTGETVNKLIKSQSQNTIKWKIKNRKDIYADNWDYIILQELARQFTTDTVTELNILQTKELNILKRVINTISTIYSEPAERMAAIGEGEDAVQDAVYQEILDYSDYDFFMQHVNRYTNLCNAVLQRIVWRDNRIDFDLLTFDNVEIMTDPHDWRKIIAVKMFMGLKLPYYDDYVSETASGTAKLSEYMPQGATQERYEDYQYSYLYALEKDNEADDKYSRAMLYKYQYRKGGEEKLISVEQLPYYDAEGNPVLPFVLYTKNFPIDKLLDFTTGDDLTDLTIQAAISYVHFNNLMKFQSWKQIYITTDDPSKIPAGIGLNPQRIAVFPAGREGNTSVGTLDLQANLREQYDTIMQRIKTGLAQYGMDAESFMRTGSPESGYALKVKKEGLQEIRRDQLPVYRQRENEAFEIIRIVNNYHNTKKISEDAVFNIDFADPSYIADDEANARLWSAKIANNVATPLDWIKWDNPDIEDDDEAMEVYNKNKAVNNATRIAMQPTQQPQTAEQGV